MLLLLRATACLEMKKRVIFPADLTLPYLHLCCKIVEKRLISVSCTIQVAVWKVLLYLQVAEQTEAREEGGRGEEEEETEREERIQLEKKRNESRGEAKE